jgi:GNAT superfamily N-acetyltransferase
MQIKNASQLDKNEVLEFCKNTFSWGDYIAQVWDYWISEGNLIAAYEENHPIGILHASMIPKANQVWIEGIRINPDFRRKGIAKQLVMEAEVRAKNQNCFNSFMLIETNNKNSLNLVRYLDYQIEDTWNFYSLTPMKLNLKTKVQFVNNQNVLENIISSNISFVKSWRWIPLDESEISLLLDEKRIIFSENNEIVNGLAIFTDSDHFDKTILVTIIISDKQSLPIILDYIRNYAYDNHCERIQILTQLDTHLDYENFEKRLSFHRMKKTI